DRQTVPSSRRGRSPACSCAYRPAALRCQTAAPPASRWTGTVFPRTARSTNSARRDAALASSPRKRRWYPGGSFKPHRLGRRLVPNLFKDCEILILQANFATQSRQGIAHADALRRLHRVFQDGAHLGLRTAPVLGGAHAERPMHLIR